MMGASGRRLGAVEFLPKCAADIAETDSDAFKK
jgi:hypothetical protein